MYAPELKEESFSIVLRGQFNPIIFQPQWFAVQELLRPEEVSPDVVDVEIIHPQVLRFKTDWFVLTVQQDSFQAITSDRASLPLLRDLVHGTFTLLSHTPVRVLGINYMCHYQLSSEDEWHVVADNITPNTHWDSVLETPRTESLTKQGHRPDKHEGEINVTLEPSRRFTPGMHIKINDHFAFVAPTSEELASAGEKVPIIEDVGEDSRRRADEITDTILAWRS